MWVREPTRDGKQSVLPKKAVGLLTNLTIFEAGMTYSLASSTNNVISFVASLEQDPTLNSGHSVYTLYLHRGTSHQKMRYGSFSALPTNATPWRRSPTLHQCAGFYPLCCLLKVYRSLCLLSIRQFERGDELLLDALSAFAATESVSYNDLVIRCRGTGYQSTSGLR